MNFPHKNQFAGSLIGQCLGDALGFVVEYVHRLGLEELPAILVAHPGVVVPAVP